MKRLYVGCRVRIVRADFRPNMLNATARIVRHTKFGSGDWDLDVDGFAPPPIYGYWVVDSDQLEPIQDPDLNQVITWADMEGLWTPSGVEA